VKLNPIQLTQFSLALALLCSCSNTKTEDGPIVAIEIGCDSTKDEHQFALMALKINLLEREFPHCYEDVVVHGEDYVSMNVCQGHVQNIEFNLDNVCDGRYFIRTFDDLRVQD